MKHSMDKKLHSAYLDEMTLKYDIQLEYGENFAEATSPYLEGVVEYGVDIYQALLCLCNSIEVTQEYNYLYRK